MKKRKKHTPEQIVAKLRDADVLLNSGKDVAAVCRAWRSAKQFIIAGVHNTEA